MPFSDSLRQSIRRKYPFPISHAYTYLESRVDPQDCHAALLNCFEVTLKTILAAINIYREFVLDRTGETLDELRAELAGHVRA